MQRIKFAMSRIVLFFVLLFTLMQMFFLPEIKIFLNQGLILLKL